MYLEFISAAAISFFICFLLIYLDKQADAAGDSNLRNSPQTIHTKSVSRFGGVAIFLALIITLYVAGLSWNNSIYFQVIILAFPAFLVGFLDDLKIEVTPLQRILMLIPVPLLFFYFTNLEVRSLELGVFDNFLKIDLLAIIFLVFCIVGMINAFNLIDGINGLLVSYIFTIIISLQMRDNVLLGELFYLAEYPVLLQILTGSLLAFFVLNLFGKIFMGDAGSYFLGALVCWILIHQYQTIGASAWSVMLILSYPFTDLVFSVIRRKFLTDHDLMQPDSMHLHHVIYKRLGKLKFKKEGSKHLLVTMAIFIFNLPYLLCAVFYYQNSLLLKAIFIFYILSYLLFYFSLSPKFLIKK